MELYWIYNVILCIDISENRSVVAVVNGISRGKAAVRLDNRKRESHPLTHFAGKSCSSL